MDEEYKEYLKSAFADLPNIGGRYGGSITAAWFLREFADPTPGYISILLGPPGWMKGNPGCRKDRPASPYGRS